MAGPFALWADVKALLAGKQAKPLNTAVDGQVLTADSSSSVGSSWKTPPAGSGGGGTVSDATSTTKGVLALAGDLAGTADLPALKQIRANAVTVGASDQVPVITVDQQGRVSAASSTALALSPTSITGFDEYVQDLIAAMIQPGTGVTTSYDDTQAKLTIAATGSGSSGGISETNLVSVRRQAANGTYSNAPSLQPDTTLYFVGTSVPDSSNPAVADGSLFSILDTSS